MVETLLRFCQYTLMTSTQLRANMQQKQLSTHVNKYVGQCKLERGNFLHTTVQQEHRPGVAFTRQYVYICNITPTCPGLLTKTVDQTKCGIVLHGNYISVLGAVVWAVSIRAGLTAYVQTLQRKTHALTIKHCKKLNLIIKCVKRDKCCFKHITIKHPLELIAFIDATFLNTIWRTNKCGIPKIGCRVARRKWWR